MMLEEQEELQQMLEELKTEHRDLDVVIEQLSDATPIDAYSPMAVPSAQSRM